MFTGLIEEIGTVVRIQRTPFSVVLTIDAQAILDDLHIGDSVAVNGVCLTVAALQGQGFSADVMHETINRSGLASLKTGSQVNLERAMAVNGRFGGHLVSGHVDGAGTISRIWKDGNAVWYAIQTEEAIMRYIVEKGSVALDGISLTVAKVAANGFSVSVIPHTAAVTILNERRVGDSVNIETDIIGKYVEKLLHPADLSSKSRVTREFLTKCGY